MFRHVLAGMFLVALAQPTLLAQAAGGGANASDTDHEATFVRHGAACGVRRWLGKPGMDSDVRQVDTRHVVTTTGAQMRALPTPHRLPATRRWRPGRRAPLGVLRAASLQEFQRVHAAAPPQDDTADCAADQLWIGAARTEDVAPN